MSILGKMRKDYSKPAFSPSEFLEDLSAKGLPKLAVRAREHGFDFRKSRCQGSQRNQFTNQSAWGPLFTPILLLPRNGILNGARLLKIKIFAISGFLEVPA